MEKEVEQVNQVNMAELLATVSHELRSPLASIRGYAATLLRYERRISREERHEFLVAINDASKRLEMVIDRMLEMSQLEIGTIVIQPTLVNLVHLVREAITACEQRVAASGGSSFFSNPPISRSSSTKQVAFGLCLEESDGKPAQSEPCIQADRQRLREVLDNVLENAMIYSPEGGNIEVGIRTLATQEDGDKTYAPPAQSHKQTALSARPPRSQCQMVEVWVRDSGIGIAPQHLEQIFEDFQRVDTRLIREVNGLGLGLAISKRIVELHDGIIWAESDLGKGSTFHIWLPMHKHASSLVHRQNERMATYACKENDDFNCR